MNRYHYNEINKYNQSLRVKNSVQSQMLFTTLYKNHKVFYSQDSNK